MESKVFVAKLFQGDGTIVVVIGNESFTVTPDSRNYSELKAAFKANDAEEFYRLVNMPLPSQEETISAVSSVDESVKVEVVNGYTFVNGVQLSNQIAEAIYRFAMEGMDYQPLVNFLKRLLQNPSSRAVNELYAFLEVCGLSITEDGCFLAYKTVRSDYLDKYSGKISNKPGESPPRMKRNEVDDNCNNTCSRGYHVGALAYAGPGGWYNSPDDRVVICKVDPADVVSVPVDHSFQKLRCCFYTVVSEFKGELNRACYSGKVSEEDYKSTFDDDCDDDVEFIPVLPKDTLIGWEYEIEYYMFDNNVGCGNFIVTDRGNDYLLVESTDDSKIRCMRLDFDDIESIHSID